VFFFYAGGIIVYFKLTSRISVVQLGERRSLLPSVFWGVCTIVVGCVVCGKSPEFCDIKQIFQVAFCSEIFLRGIVFWGWRRARANRLRIACVLRPRVWPYGAICDTGHRQ